MFSKQLRVALLAGGILAAVVGSARAEDCCGKPADCTPQYRTVCSYEWVPENYETTRTVYKKECREETYTAYRCETVPETRTRNVTTYRKVTENVVECRKVCVKVPVCEERTCMEKHYTCVPETKCVRKCVDKGHWECKEVECGPSLKDRLTSKLHHHKCGCSDPCANSCDSCNTCNTCCETPCPKTKTVRTWVSCPTWEEHTCTVMKRVCEERPVTRKVTVYKTEVREEQHTVCKTRCIPECKTETYTVCCTKRVPYEAKRTVSVCVPTCEKVTCTRMVCKKTEKQVAVAPCSTCCNDACGNSCCDDCSSNLLSKLLSKLKSHGSHGCGCDSGCSSGCSSCK